MTFFSIGWNAFVAVTGTFLPVVWPRFVAEGLVDVAVHDRLHMVCNLCI